MQRIIEIEKVEFIDEVVEDAVRRYGRSRRALIPILQSIQARLGYLPRSSLECVSNHLGIPLSTIYGVATFYHQFILEPPGMYIVQVCMGTACYIRGNSENYRFLLNLLGIEPNGRTSKDGLFTVLKVRCLGCCSLAPVIKVGDEVYGRVSFNEIRRITSSCRSKARADNPKPG
ncbi:MAG: NAD(P)H-dependent oxidoreductase subunit E [Candidatus Bathyarchaeia archaeon]